MNPLIVRKLLVEDEGEGIQELDAWNEFYRRRRKRFYRVRGQIRLAGPV